MPSSSFEINLYQGRTISYTVALFQQDGVTPVILVSGDTVRFSISIGTGLPSLDLSNDTPTSNGSVVTVTNLNPGTVTIKFCQGDTALLYDVTYDAELRVVDATDSDLVKTVELGVVHVIPTSKAAIGP
jgi:hypothetical protein